MVNAVNFTKITIMKPEHAEIGALIEEITVKGFGGFQTDVNDTCTPRVVSVTIYQSRIDAVTPQSFLDGMRFEANCLIDALTMAVNRIRRSRQEPSLQDEVAELMREQEAHAHELIVCGDDAACTCGSTRDLIVERKFTLAASWKTGCVSVTDEAFAMRGDLFQPGELGRCPDCGKWYQLHA